jgi:hypothetical protein
MVPVVPCNLKHIEASPPRTSRTAWHRQVNELMQVERESDNYLSSTISMAAICDLQRAVRYVCDASHKLTR